MGGQEVCGRRGEGQCRAARLAAVCQRQIPALSLLPPPCSLQQVCKHRLGVRDGECERHECCMCSATLPATMVVGGGGGGV